MKEEQLTRHFLGIGQSGTGKTNLNNILLKQLLQKDIPFTVLDFKQDYRHLLNHTEFEDEITVIPWEQLQYNPLKVPENTKPRRWMLQFTDVFGHSQSLMSASRNFFLRELNDTYRKKDQPTMGDLRRTINRTRNGLDSYKKQQYCDTVLNRIDMLTFAAQTMFETESPFPLEKLLKQNIVIELDGLNSDAQALIAETLLTQTFLHRKNNGMRNKGLQHIFLMDEGKHIFSQEKADKTPGIPAVDMAAAQFREFGEGLIVTDQEPSKLSESIKANTATKYMLPTGSNKQFQEAASALKLTDEQKEYARRKLDTGKPLVYNRSTGLAPVDVPYMPLEKTVSDERVQENFEARRERLTAN